jgi:hypothetical protein
MPENLNPNFMQYVIVFYTVLCCVVPMFGLMLGVFLAYRNGSSFINNFITPDIDKMHTAFDTLKQKYPNKTTDELVRRIIRRQSLRCGAIGAMTGLGGLPTLPITITIDLLLSYRIQGAMVNFIARAYDHDPNIPKEEELVTSMVMFGSSRLTESTTRAATRALTNVIGEVGSKVLAKIIPLVGAVIGFAVNYLTTQATGRMAASVYSGQVVSAGGGLFRWVRSPFRRKTDDESPLG